MENSRLLHISTGASRKATVWPQSEISWADFTEKLKTPVRSTETYEEYLKLPKSRQDELKDVGGYVGGTLSGNRRKAPNVTGRDLITLDLDNIPTGRTDDIIRRVDGLGCAAVIYSTRKHSEFSPRLRIVIPTDRTATADEYEPAARKVGHLIGIEYCDPTTFEASRLMYWGSCCKDAVYVYQVMDKAFCSVDGILGMYEDWRNVKEWPQVPGTEALERRRLAKQEDPTTKEGVIGAFCRTYSVTEAMAAFIPGMYEETDTPGRYTYTGGSTVGGAVVYDGDKFLFSHHATDPCGGQLVNAFDLVRLHVYGDRDQEAKEGTPSNKLPSFLAMEQAALKDQQVSSRLASERHDRAVEAFAAKPEGMGSPRDAPDDLTWMEKLTVDGKGNYRKTINNAVLILQNDKNLKDKIVTDDFAGCGLVMGSVPWNPSDERRRWDDMDDSGVLWYMETYYDLGARDKLDAALAIVGGQNRINEVSSYLQGLTWDGRPRLDGLLSEYLGAEDNPYTRAVMRKSLCAAVARAINGGVKYDYMPILAGPQGIGKSTFLNILGKGWFCDSLTTFEGKEAAEVIQGMWIVEVGELTAFSRQETNSIKQFLSKRDDIYRAAYGRRTERHVRRCVFFGTSNDSEFLKDATGNRRFWPVDVGINEVKKSVWNDLPKEVDQIWAEAYARWMTGENLFMPKEIEYLAIEAQENHSETSEKEGLVLDFLDTEVPENWEAMSISQRRQFLQGNLKVDGPLARLRKVCAAEVWVEVFNSDLKYMKRADAAEINTILSKAKGWTANRSKRRYGPYGILKGYERQ